jgi:hypothetical protein
MFSESFCKCNSTIWNSLFVGKWKEQERYVSKKIIEVSSREPPFYYLGERKVIRRILCTLIDSREKTNCQ